MNVVQYQLPGEHKTNLLIYLLKMNMNSFEKRIKLEKFLENNSLFRVLLKQWNELSKSTFQFK